MCEPTLIAGASLAFSGLSAYHQYQQGQYASDVAEQNADVVTAQANDAINRGNAQADQNRRDRRQRAGAQAATLAATGADISSGTALDIFGDTAQFGTLDALTTVNNAQREAYGYQAQAANYLSQASAARQQGKMGALSTPLNAYGAYQFVGSKWNPFRQEAAPISAAIGTKIGKIRKTYANRPDCQWPSSGESRCSVPGFPGFFGA